MKADLAAELAEIERVKGLLKEVEGQSDDAKAKFLITKDVAETICTADVKSMEVMEGSFDDETLLLLGTDGELLRLEKADFKELVTSSQVEMVCAIGDALQAGDLFRALLAPVLYKLH